jgi:hypothetical protein
MRLQQVNHFYEILEEVKMKFPARKLDELLEIKNNIPTQGVYFFFEKGEFRTGSTTERVVRIGTHAAQAKSRATIKNRLAQHKGPEHLIGRHRSSVFRELIGYSLMTKRNLNMTHWGQRALKSDKQILNSEQALEREVSRYLREMRFTILEIPGEASKDNDRAFIERNAIGLLSNYQKEIIDPASENWLGRLCCKPKIRESGLWNSKDVEIATIDPSFVTKMEDYLRRMKNWDF